jgi:ribonuclease I
MLSPLQQLLLLLLSPHRLITKLSILLLLTLTIILQPIQSTTTTAMARCDNNKPSYDVVVLNLQWPPAFGMPQEWFMAHGCWPSRSMETKWPCYCNKSSMFDVKSLDPDVKSGMEYYFASLTGRNEDLWKPEWEMHGSCCAKDANTFFSQAVSMRNQLRPIGMLKRSGITPSTNAIPYNTIASALRGATLGCSPVKSDGFQILQTINFCLDVTMSNTVLCPPSATVSTCRADVPIRLIPGSLTDKNDPDKISSSISTTVAGSLLACFVGVAALTMGWKWYQAQQEAKKLEEIPQSEGEAQAQEMSRSPSPTTEDEEEQQQQDKDEKNPDKKNDTHEVVKKKDDSVNNKSSSKKGTIRNAQVAVA